MASTSVSSDCTLSSERASRSSPPSDDEPAMSKRRRSYYKSLERKVYVMHSVLINT